MAISGARTVGDELRAYLKSARFRSNATSVKREYSRVAAHLEWEIGDTELEAINRAWVRGRRDAWAIKGHRAATIRLQVLKNALEPASSDGDLPGGLFVGLQRVNRPHGAVERNIIWKDEEVSKVIQRCIETDAEGLARAIGLGRWAGLRRQTICSVRETDRYILKREGELTVRRLRYKSEKGETIADLLEDPRLTNLLDNLTSGRGGAIAFNKRGLAWAPRQLNQALERIVAKLVRTDEVRPGLTLHGLRHARGVELAHAGASDAELMAQLAHSDEQSAKVYRRQAENRRLADRAQKLVDEYHQRGGLGSWL